jgi:hypothetical protein
MESHDRKQLLQMASSRAQAGSGSTLHMLRESRANYADESSFPDLGPIRFAVVGGLATALYMPERMTLDTDILVAEPDLSAVEDILQEGGSIQLGTLSIGGSTWRMPGGRTLDVIALERDWVQEALNTASCDNSEHPFISLHYLVLMKLESGRLQDLADISRMLGFATETQIQQTRETVSQYRPHDLEDLDSMIRLGKLEHEQRESGD